jgi:DNA-binding NarL/FixJ family response regulator
MELELEQRSEPSGYRWRGNAARAERAARLISALTPRQIDVLNGMADGLLNKQIAQFLMIDVKTVKMHRAHVLKRLNVSHSAQAVRLAVEASFADGKVEART